MIPKRLLTVKFLLFSIALFGWISSIGLLHAEGTRIRYPKESGRGCYYILIDSIDRNPKETLLYITIRNTTEESSFNDWSYLRTSSLDADGESQEKIYKFRRMEGIVNKAPFPLHQDTHIQMAFEPLEEGTLFVDFYGESWYTGIQRIYGLEVGAPSNGASVYPKNDPKQMPYKTLTHEQVAKRKTEGAITFPFPSIDLQEKYYFNLESVTRTDTATILQMRATFTRSLWLKFPSFAFLKDSHSSRTYSLKGAHGFELDSMYLSREDNHPFTLYFEPLDPEVEYIDLLLDSKSRDYGYRLLGVNVNPSIKEVRAPLSYTNTYESEIGIWRDETKENHLYKVTVTPTATKLYFYNNTKNPYINVDSTATLIARHHTYRYKFIESDVPLLKFIKHTGDEPFRYCLTFEPLHQGVTSFDLRGGVHPSRMILEDIDVPPPPLHEPLFSVLELILLALVALFVGGALVWLVARYRMKQIKAREKQKQLIVELQLKAIRSQMNPHFIFNAMASIQNLILQNRETQANDYLVEFSRLLRQVLASSEQSLVTLSDEIELITRYLKLEQLRIPFSLTVEISPEVNRYEEIPSMLLQPLVENAVVHGLKGRSNGFIGIYITQEANAIVCKIKDDGDGFSPAPEDKAEKEKARFGMRATRQRLELLGERLHTNIALEISRWSENNREGTCIRVTIPI